MKTRFLDFFLWVVYVMSAIIIFSQVDSLKKIIISAISLVVCSVVVILRAHLRENGVK